MPSSTLPSLTPPQAEAAQYGDGPLMILAGPGSGKTRVITARIAHLLDRGCSSHQILALTFTNKAADEMRQRVHGIKPGQSVWISTFHRFCSNLLRQRAGLIGLAENFTIYDATDSLKALRNVIDAEQINLVHFTADRIAQHISWAKNNLTPAHSYAPRPGSPLGAIVGQVYLAYQQRLLSLNAVDFDDLLLHVAVLLQETAELRGDLDKKYRYILVDEYQDTNLAQYAIVRSLSIDYPNLTVTGDPDQSIYGWRGANIRNILEFENDFPDVHVVRLEENYRSSGHIVCAADRLISYNSRRKAKRLYTHNARGVPVRLVSYDSQHEEASGIAASIAREVHEDSRRPRDFAIFYRVNALSRSFELALADCGLPYQIVNGVEFYQRKEVKDILAYLQVLNNPRDDVALLRIINTPPRGIGRRTVDGLRKFSRHQGLSLLAAARDHRLLDSLPKRAASHVSRFTEMMGRLAAAVPSRVENIVRCVLTESGYRDSLRDSESQMDLERLDNIEELLTAARQFGSQHTGDDCLERFLEQAVLVNDTDKWESDFDKVTLMTLHAAKGLEFAVVFITAVEHGLIPHERNRTEEDRLEEERRLLFVGMTRARQELQLSFVKRRTFRGVEKTTIPSSFLMELPREEMELVNIAESESSGTHGPQQLAALQTLEAGALNVVPPIDRLNTRRRVAAAAKVTTAADIAGISGASNMSICPEDFASESLVKHPEYGLGKILTISGSGHKRTATVQFFVPAQRKSFQLAHSPLRPVRAAASTDGIN